MSFIPDSPEARREHLYGRAVADDTLGEVVVRRLSRKSAKVIGVSPYKRTMYPLVQGWITRIPRFASFFVSSPRIANTLRRFESRGTVVGTYN